MSGRPWFHVIVHDAREEHDEAIVLEVGSEGLSEILMEYDSESLLDVGDPVELPNGTPAMVVGEPATSADGSLGRERLLRWSATEPASLAVRGHRLVAQTRSTALGAVDEAPVQPADDPGRADDHRKEVRENQAVVVGHADESGPFELLVGPEPDEAQQQEHRQPPGIALPAPTKGEQHGRRERDGDEEVEHPARVGRDSTRRGLNGRAAGVRGEHRPTTSSPAEPYQRCGSSS
jgi:hypothetical protein